MTSSNLVLYRSWLELPISVWMKLSWRNSTNSTSLNLIDGEKKTSETVIEWVSFLTNLYPLQESSRQKRLPTVRAAVERLGVSSRGQTSTNQTEQNRSETNRNRINQPIWPKFIEFIAALSDTWGSTWGSGAAPPPMPPCYPMTPPMMGMGGMMPPPPPMMYPPMMPMWPMYPPMYPTPDYCN